MSTGTSWGPALVVLVLAAVSAAVYLLVTRSRTAQATPGGDERRGPGERARSLIDQLRELDAERHLLPPAELEARKAALEQEAASALREADRTAAAATGRAPIDTRSGLVQRHPQLVGALWGGGIVLFLGLLAFSLSRDNTARRDAPTPAGSASTADQEALEKLLAEADAAPADFERSARAAHHLLRAGDGTNASRLTERVLGVDPFHPESRVHRAALWAFQGQETRATEELERLSRAYPDAYEADLFLGMFAMSRGDRAGAIARWERFLARAPASHVPPHLREAVNELRAGGRAR